MRLSPLRSADRPRLTVKAASTSVVTSRRCVGSSIGGPTGGVGISQVRAGSDGTRAVVWSASVLSRAPARPVSALDHLAPARRLGAMVACGFLAAWQWRRAGSAMGSAVNVGYGLRWPVFAVFFAYVWWRSADRDRETSPTRSRPEQGPVDSGARRLPVGRLGPLAVRLPRSRVGAIDEAENPALAEYNRMLASLAAHDGDQERREQEQEEREGLSIATALRNYRVAAWVTGIGLLVVFIAMPLKSLLRRATARRAGRHDARVPVHGLHRLHADPGRALPVARWTRS